MGRRRYALVVLALAVIGCAAHWPVVHSGLVADDYLQRSMLDGSYPVQRSTLDLFAFVDASRGDLGPLKDAGTFPWWTHPQLKLTALRPLSSLLIALDVNVLHLSPFVQHLHSLLWWLALLLVFAAFLRKRVPTALALIAVAIYAFDPASIVPLGWLANRNAIISGLFGLLALWAHIASRERGSSRSPLLAALAFALSLAGGEYALAMLGYLLAYELVAGPGGFKRRVRALWPVAIPLAAYVAVHVALGYGARGSSVYLDPLRRPLLFAVSALSRFPALLVAELLHVPAQFAHFALLQHSMAVWLSVPMLAAIAVLTPGAVRRLEPAERRTVLFLLLGSVLSMLPTLGTQPSARLLLIPALGGCVFVGVLLRDAARRFRETGALKRPLVWLGGLVGLGLLGSHVLGAPLSTFASAAGWSAAQQMPRTLYARAKLDDQQLNGRTLVLLNSFEPMTLLYPPYVRHEAGSPLPHAWRALSTTWQPIRLRRVAPDTLELATEHSSLLELPMVDLLRTADRPLRAGERFHVRGMDVEVLAMDGWGPKRLRYHFDGDLDSSRFVVLTMGAKGLERLRLPRPGHSLRLPGLSRVILDALRRP